MIKRSSVRLALVPALLIVGCSPAPVAAPDNEAAANIAGEASAPDPQASVETPLPLPTPAPSVAQSAEPETPTPSPDAVPDRGTPEAAKAVVELYYARIARRDFAGAWSLWEQGGKASDMSVQAFADGFTKYSHYRAEIGTPFDADAGAGQRYIKVPVTISGTLAGSGDPVALDGALILHRVGDIDGATPEQLEWRIRDSAIRPRPDQAEASDNGGAHVAKYRCVDGSRITVRFEDGRAAVIRGGKTIVQLRQRVTESGFDYAGGGYDLRSKGDAATFSQPKMPPLPCTGF